MLGVGDALGELGGAAHARAVLVLEMVYDPLASPDDTQYWARAARHSSFYGRATQNLRKYGPDNALLTEDNFPLPAAIAGNCAGNQKLLDIAGVRV